MPPEDRQFTYPMLSDASRQLRLLQVHPGHDDVRITASLMVRDVFGYSPTLGAIRKIPSSPAYMAISYTWGSPRPTRSVLVNDMILDIGENCWLVMWQCRHHSVSTPIWIDAICIDQTNNIEKGQQVQMMADVYRNAQMVLVSLGDHKDDSLHAIETLDRFAKSLGRLHEKDDDSIRETDDSQQVWEAWFRTMDQEGKQRICTALGEFGRRTYWNRLWIVQELRMATKISVMCGGSIMSWTSLVGACRAIVKAMPRLVKKAGQRPVLSQGLEDYSITPEIRHGMNTVRSCAMSDFVQDMDQSSVHSNRNPYSRSEQNDLAAVIDRYGDRGCAEPRDALYGLIRVVEWPALGQLPVDYTISLFQLSMRALLYYDWTSSRIKFLDFCATLRNTLQIDESSEAQDLMRCRREAWREHCEDEFFTARSEATIDSQLKRHGPVIFKHCGVLSHRRDGHFEGLLMHDGEFRVRLKDLQLQLAAADKEAQAFAIDCIDHGLLPPQSMRSDDGLQALICSSAKPGDILAWNGDIEEGHLLILRQLAGENLAIVGQATQVEGFVCGSPDRKHEPGEFAVNAAAEIYFDTYWDSEDLLAYVLQDDSDMPRYFDEVPVAEREMVSSDEDSDLEDSANEEEDALMAEENKSSPSSSIDSLSSDGSWFESDLSRLVTSVCRKPFSSFAVSARRL